MSFGVCLISDVDGFLKPCPHWRL